MLGQAVEKVKVEGQAVDKALEPKTLVRVVYTDRLLLSTMVTPVSMIPLTMLSMLLLPSSSFFSATLSLLSLVVEGGLGFNLSRVGEESIILLRVSIRSHQNSILQ